MKTATGNAPSLAEHSAMTDFENGVLELASRAKMALMRDGVTEGQAKRKISVALNVLFNEAVREEGR